MLQLVAHEELEVDEYLVVAGTTGVDFLTHIPEFGSEHEFHLRVYILYPFLNSELSAFDYIGDFREGFEQHIEFLGCEQSDTLKHLDMSHRALHVISGKTQVKFPVISNGKFFDYFVGLEALAPKFHILN